MRSIEYLRLSSRIRTSSIVRSVFICRLVLVLCSLGGNGNSLVSFDLLIKVVWLLLTHVESLASFLRFQMFLGCF